MRGGMSKQRPSNQVSNYRRRHQRTLTDDRSLVRPTAALEGGTGTRTVPARQIVMAGRAAVTGAVGMAALATACGTSARPVRPAPQPGVVAGFAELCSGLLANMLRPPPPPMVVYAQRNGQVIATSSLGGTGGRYRMPLAPGDYTISVPRSKDPPRGVTVLSGRTVTANFPNQCG